MSYIGFILVAVFFFLSGYGLKYGLDHKDKYLNGFLAKKVFRIYLPYWIAITVVIVMQAYSGTTYSLKEYIFTYLGFDMITKLWFVTAIIVMYLSFWISFRLSSKHGLIVLLILTIFYSATCILAELNSSYTASVFAFVFGVAWSRIEKPWIGWIRKNYWIKFSMTIGCFVVLFAGRLVLSLRGIDNEVLHFVFRNIVSIAFIFAILTVLQKIEVKTGVIQWFGKISYEIYIVHCVLLSAISKYVTQQDIYVVVVFAVAVIVSFILHQVCQATEKSYCGE